ncbi:uncharacterized protein RHIMIDRAFT_235945 [Rhizopus microsporus ATCC 52813]|uniref:Uncharacterized protein n=1 Tax=Rhizopus microsporus ATCC 52813 TaxID=1340429 RepID=A0A2G4SYY2_RHIZD|nr:uncharacterized protein RHIMIDRAFT_235945 [Rhizopus microsporus ATCC 52813]PHZ13944.1 hypothetical protein RHIMIDRAFT_235945 [Rhizopus microsporus ATCC 52813]
MENHSNWKRTSDFTLYWLERKQLRARLGTQEPCSNYVENVLGEQTATLTTSFQSTTLPHTNDTRSVTSDNVEFTPFNVIYRHDHVEVSSSSPLLTTTLRLSTLEREDDGPVSPSSAVSASSSRNINARPVVPWMFNGSNMAELFQTFQHKVAALSRANLLQIETSIHEILALLHIFLICPSQHSKQIIDVFFKEKLYDVHQSFVQKSMDKNIDITDGICANIARIIDSVEQKVRSKDEATALLSRLCINLDEHASSVIHGIIKAMAELPLQAISNKTSIVSCLHGSANRRRQTFTVVIPLLLRWTNIETDSSAKKKRPDATITKLNQLAFGYSLGFEEAKIAQSTPDKYNFCYDLLRLALFCKETIDKNQLNASLAFQIHGFSVVFFLMRLDHDGIYYLYEVGKLSFSRSLEELPGFVSLKNLNTLMRISEMFWRMCKPVSAQGVDTLSDKYRPIHPSLYTLIDGTKNRHRVCAMYFGD